jgi:predicted component of type VI protein secretion system
MADLVLTWQLPGGQARSYLVTDARPALIGRSAEQCDVVIDDPTISRRHASIYADGGTFYLRNESATNVVHFNNHYRLAQHQAVPLRPGDSFRIGPVQIQAAARAAQPQGQVPKIKCHRCGNICDYNPEEFCPHCGEALAAGQTVFITG